MELDNFSYLYEMELSNKSYLYLRTTPSGSPSTGGELITKRFSLLWKEGLGEVVV